MIQKLKDLIVRVESWPADAQAELVELALEIEAEQHGIYQATEDEIEKGEAIQEAVAEAIFARARGA